MELFDDNEYWYRYEDVRTNAGVDIRLRKYPVVRNTPCGVWIKLGLGEEKFVRSDTRKKFACPTRTKALESFKHRKRVQANILKQQLRRAEGALKAVDPDYKGLQEKLNDFKNSMVDTPSDFAKIIDDNFWELL